MNCCRGLFSAFQLLTAARKGTHDRFIVSSDDAALCELNRKFQLQRHLRDGLHCAAPNKARLSRSTKMN